MNYEIENVMEEAIKSQFESLKTLPAGSEERSRQVEDSVKLYRAYVDAAKVEQDKKQLKKQDIDMYLKYGVQIGVPTITGIFYLMMFVKGLKFEETGFIRSTICKGFVNRVNPPKL